MLAETVTRYKVSEEDGELESIQQESAFNPQTQKNENNTIQAESLFWMANDMEGDNYRGESLIRSAYRSYLHKDSLVRKMGIQAQRAATAIPSIKLKNPDKEDDAIEYGKKLQVSEEAYAITTDDFDVGMIGGKEMFGFDLLPYVKYHDAQIANIVFAHFVLQGAEKVGARAMQGDNIDFFKEGLEAFIQDIVDMFNLGFGRMNHNQQILIRNFPGEFECPKLKISGLKQTDMSSVSAVFKTLVDSGGITAREGDEQFFRKLGGYKEFDLEESDEPVIGEPQKETEEEAKEFLESEDD